MLTVVPGQACSYKIKSPLAVRRGGFFSGGPAYMFG